MNSHEKLVGALKSLEDYKERHLVPPYFLNALADIRAVLATIAGTASAKDPNARLRDLITLVCDAAFACGDCDERDDVTYKPLFEAEQVAITNLKNYVAMIRCGLHAATPPDTPVVAREIAREIVEDHLAPCAECFGNAMRDIENAIATIITRHLAGTPPASFIEAFRNTAIKLHGAYGQLVRLKPRLHDEPLEHQGPWEECDWIECEDRRKMIAELEAATPSPEGKREIFDAGFGTNVEREK